MFKLVFFKLSKSDYLFYGLLVGFYLLKFNNKYNKSNKNPKNKKTLRATSANSANPIAQ